MFKRANVAHLTIGIGKGKGQTLDTMGTLGRAVLS